jgi:flagellar motor switch protein FliN/FliY
VSEPGEPASPVDSNPAAKPPKPNPTKDIEKRLDDADATMSQAQLDELLQNAMGPAAPRAADPVPFQLGDLQNNPTGEPPHPMDLLNDVELDLRIELGRTQMRLEEVLHLRGGSVVALDKLAGDPVDVYVNGRLIAHGEVLVMNDNFCIRVTELIGAS